MPGTHFTILSLIFTRWIGACSCKWQSRSGVCDPTRNLREVLMQRWCPWNTVFSMLNIWTTTQGPAVWNVFWLEITLVSTYSQWEQGKVQGEEP